MSQPANTTGREARISGSCARMRAGEGIALWRCRGIAFSVFVFLVLVAIPAGSQSSFPAPAGQTDTQVSTGEGDDATFGGLLGGDSEPDSSPAAAPNPAEQGQQAPFSAAQMIHILQQNPDLTLELKSALAERMQSEGMQIDQDQISDDFLYRQIEMNATLRARASILLRARGYVPDAEDPPVAGSFADAGVDNGFMRVSEQDPPLPPMEDPQVARERSRQEKDRSREEKANASTDLPVVIRKPPPYNLQSMRDLYAQFPNQPDDLKRFGSEVFVNRPGTTHLSDARGLGTPLDVPLGPDYVVGPGDTLKIDLWGGVTQSISRTVDPDGSILLPEAGSVELAGLPLGKVQSLIEGALTDQFRNAQVAVTVSRLRSVRVYVVGDVQRPGGYDISSLSTPLSALYAAGGPTQAGSFRMLLHYRGSQLVEEVDLYDFLLHGIRKHGARFESGDTLLVPPAGALVAIDGAVKRPAIYELKGHTATLAEVMADAGGITAAASLSHITVDRIDANHLRETVAVPDRESGNPLATVEAIAAFTVRDGDRIHIEPILPYSQRSIYLAGHVVRPGRLPYSDGMRLSDVLRSDRDVLPEPADHGEIVRLVPPDLHAEIIDFNVSDVLEGHANVKLQPYDTIRVFGRYQVDAPTVTISGEVLRPGTYPMSVDMTAAQLVRMAGGFKRDALLASADLTSYKVENGNRVIENVSTVPIGAAVDGTESNADVPLKPGDTLAVHQISNWNDIGESVTIDGQVKYPGSYGFKEGDRLSSVLRRAGGFLPTAYPTGAVFIRDQVRDLQQKSRDQLIRQIETNSAAARLSPSLSGANGGTALQLIQAQQTQVISSLKSHPPSGRMVIHISADIYKWANTPADIELRRGDVLTIPKQPGFVLITGQVYNATALSFTPGKSAEWYLRRAGGTSAAADRKEIFIIRANGTLVGRHSGGWFDGEVLSTKLNPGDVVVVPQKIIGGSFTWRNLLTTGQIASSIAITAGVAAATL